MAELVTLDLSEARRAAIEARNTFAAPEVQKRAYNAAMFTRLTEDWPTMTTSADLDLWADIYRLRARARRESQNNPLARKAIKVAVKNIVGPKGISMRAKIPMKRGKKLNEQLNLLIENQWALWSHRKYCTVRGDMSWQQAQRFAVKQVWRDGECFIRLITYKNKFNFALQFIDPDQLDTNYFLYSMPNGNQIRMGIEVDTWGRPVAYHFWDRDPAEYSISPKNRIRVPAEEVIHLYDPDRVMQSRGVSELASSLLTMHMLERYTMAEVVAARVAAAKMGFFEKTGDAGYTGDASERDSEGNLRMKAAPGTAEQLPEGVTFKPWDPQHPTTAFPAFTKMLCRMIGAGADISYETLANDREGVNFSSIRAGLLDDRDTWKIWQDHMCGTFCAVIFEAWLEKAWLSGLIPLDGIPEDYFQYFTWTPRGFPWVDPLKDTQTNVLALRGGLDTRTDLLAANGMDFEETMQQLADEQDKIKQLGLSFLTDIRGDFRDQIMDETGNGNGSGSGSGKGSGNDGKSTDEEGD